LFVDWAGARIPVHDPENGAIHEAALFVAVLGASTTPTPKLPGARSCNTGLARTCLALSFWRCDSTGGSRQSQDGSDAGLPL
jgi:hypothetical protein